MTRNSIWLMWTGVIALGLVTMVVGGIAGYRADAASILPPGQTDPSVQVWRTALWVLVAVVVVGALAAAILTVRRLHQWQSSHLWWAVTLIGGGLLGALLFLPLGLLAFAGLGWLAVQDRNTPTTV